MHDNVSDGPSKPEPEGRPSMADAIESAMAAMPDGMTLTPPELGCLTQEETDEVGQAGAALIAAYRLKSATVLEAVLDKYAAMGGHLVGHGLNTLLWSSFQSMLVMNGIIPHDDASVVMNFSIVDPARERTEQDAKTEDMVVEFVKGTLAGAHQAAMGAWAQWVGELAEEDWDSYTTGIAGILSNVFDMVGAEVEENADASELLGERMAHIKPRTQKQHGF